jgi:hypothetical protein
MQTLEKWFDWCNTEIDKIQNYTGRLEATTNYLQANSNLEVSGEYQSIQEDEIGCRLIQSVLVGAMVHPVYVYNPQKLNKGTTMNETDLQAGD